MKNMSYKVTENNGGGIALYCVDASGEEFAFNGYEFNPEQIFGDITTLLTDKSVDDWENNQLKEEDMCRRFRTTYDSESGEEICDEDEMFDEEGNLIPLDVDEYFDDHETTSTVLVGDQTQMTIYRSVSGHNFSQCLKHLHLLFGAEDYCPKIVIE
jgi:hypothetical protein